MLLPPPALEPPTRAFFAPSRPPPAPSPSSPAPKNSVASEAGGRGGQQRVRPETFSRNRPGRIGQVRRPGRTMVVRWESSNGSRRGGGVPRRLEPVICDSSTLNESLEARGGRLLDGADDRTLLPPLATEIFGRDPPPLSPSMLLFPSQGSQTHRFPASPHPLTYPGQIVPPTSVPGKPIFPRKH